MQPYHVNPIQHNNVLFNNNSYNRNNNVIQNGHQVFHTVRNLLITLKRARKWVERASIKTLIINEEANYLTLDVLALR
jgi:predicted metal-dependent TIM-barrel fold hydrolase